MHNAFLCLLEANRHAPIANARAAQRGFWIADRDPEEDGDVDDPNRPDDDEASVYVYDVIDANWGVSAQQVVPALAALNAKTIHLHINSPGGDVFEARALKTALEQHSARVVATVDGIAASAASFLMMAADDIAIAPGPFVMIHNPWGFAMGDAEEMRKTAQLLDQIAAVIAGDYVAKTVIPSAEILAMMEEETWMDAETAVAKKFCDRILAKPAKAQALNRFDLSAYSKAPDMLATLAAEDQQFEAARDRHARILRLLQREPA
jgi:ATP-dependent Clp protease protease subunit